MFKKSLWQIVWTQVCSGFTLFASILNSSVMLGNICSRRLQQTTFSDGFFLGALRVKSSTYITEVSMNLHRASRGGFVPVFLRKYIATRDFSGSGPPTPSGSAHAAYRSEAV